MQGRAMLMLVAGVLAAAVACTPSTEFKSTWKNPSARLLELQGKKVAALVLTSSQTLRRNAESAVARELAARGANAIPGYELVDDDQLQDNDAVRQILQKAGVDAAVVMRVVDRRQELSYMASAPGLYYGSFWGYYGGGAVAHPGYVWTNTIVSVETLLYSVPDNKLLWGGVSESIDPFKLDRLVKDVLDAAAKEMKKAGLIAP